MEEYNPFNLKGKTILVTGASSGIGRAVAVECSRMGAKLVISGRNRDRLQETMEMLEGECPAFKTADLTDSAQVKDLLSGMEPGTLDGLVLCAGTGMTRPVKCTHLSKMEEIFRINLFAQTELLKLVTAGKLFRKGASVVAISSVAAGTSIHAGKAAYGSGKAALETYMKYAALELAPGVRVNCIRPGMVETPLIHKGVITEEQLENDSRSYPMGGYGKAEDVARGAVYLLSDAAAWITGSVLTIDGGISLL